MEMSRGKGSAETREHAGERDGRSSCQSCGTAEAQRREVFGGSIQRGADVLAELIASTEGVRCHRSSGGDRGLGGQEQAAVELLGSEESEGWRFLQDCGGPAMGGAQLWRLVGGIRWRWVCGRSSPRPRARQASGRQSRSDSGRAHFLSPLCLRPWACDLFRGQTTKRNWAIGEPIFSADYTCGRGKWVAQTRTVHVPPRVWRNFSLTSKVPVRCYVLKSFSLIFKIIVTWCYQEQ
jgi:hypothetical protein